jgi:hypothetical protein
MFKTVHVLYFLEIKEKIKKITVSLRVNYYAMQLGNLFIFVYNRRS